MRKNNKLHTINFENSIKKSNQLSMAKLSQGLSLNQLQLLYFAIEIWFLRIIGDRFSLMLFGYSN